MAGMLAANKKPAGMAGGLDERDRLFGDDLGPLRVILLGRDLIGLILLQQRLETL
jgi:hypothetical protein